VHRKVVTVLFCDVVGSTALGESVDSEVLQSLLARYFERMQAIVEAHEGTVEKFIGDAVMAVFGVPQVHEDDALRACRAAAEMRDAFSELGVQGRIGVNTGEVVTGTEERLAAGDAVNVAARFQNAAESGQILIGPATLELVGGAVETEPVGPLTLKGKTKPVPAFRLITIHEAPERSHETPFVGRDAELSLIHKAWARVLEGRTCELITVVGEAGVGKSRLVTEALASIDARIVSGRCLPYGEGITYWPVVGVIKQLDALPSDPAAAAAIRSLLGETDAGTTAEEIAWAFRKLLEEVAPLVVVLDDIQWGDETFLDLVEGTALLSSGSPILLVCMARPELADRRPQWPVTVRLVPLPADAVDALIGERVSAELRARIATAAAGNPLFLTEMLAMAAEGESVDVPPTLRALLAARLDQLDPAERRVLEGGAVEGEIFHRAAVQALTPDELQLTPRLAGLVRRELIRPDRAQLPGEDGFRFRHLLIRDAAYDALPKSARADLHERFADWLEHRGTDLVELDEILGYHLEQAASLRAELGRADSTLAERAGDRLAAAGRRAVWRGDEPAAVSLLERAVDLVRTARFDVGLELDLAHALSRDPRRATAIADAAAERAREAGDRAGEALARFCGALDRTVYEDDVDLDEVERLGQTAIPLLEKAGNDAGLVWVWWGLAYGVANRRGRMEDWIRASERALEHSHRAGQRVTYLFRIESALAYGSPPADDALRTLDALLPENPHPQLLMYRAWLLAMLGRSAEAAELSREAGERWRELTGDDWVELVLGYIAATSGDHVSAATHFRRFCAVAEQRGQRAILWTYAGALGRELCLIGEYDEAARWARMSQEVGTQEDILTQMLWRQAQALVHARHGEHAQAEPLARAAVELAEPTDFLSFQGDAFRDLAEVLAAAGRVEEAAEAYEQALDRYNRKKNLAMVAQVQPRLDALRAEVGR
jgi:class 3 adenylate cyclase/tetratricopeptide (TPR) repeat protein